MEKERVRYEERENVMFTRRTRVFPRSPSAAVKFIHIQLFLQLFPFCHVCPCQAQVTTLALVTGLGL